MTPATGSPARKLWTTTPPASLAPSAAAPSRVRNTSSRVMSTPRRVAKSANTPAQASSSPAPLLACTMATGCPAGVQTTSMSGSAPCHGRSSMLIAKTLVPTLTLTDRVDAVGRHHPGPRVALGRAGEGSGSEAARGVEEERPCGGQGAGGEAVTSTRGSSSMRRRGARPTPRGEASRPSTRSRSRWSQVPVAGSTGHLRRRRRRRGRAGRSGAGGPNRPAW